MLVKLFITCPMASSQMITSKKPMNGARYLIPFQMKMTRMLPSVRSQMRAQKIMNGSTTKANTGDVRKTSTMITYFFTDRGC